jgi:heat shock protein HtpX
MLRIALFLITNLAVLVLLGTALTVLGAAGILPPELLEARGALLVVAAIFGFGGALVSLLLSKSIARWTTGAVVIDLPRTHEEAWLLDAVAALARRAGIGCPDVAIYDSPAPNAFATGWNRDESLVAVSTGLLQSMERAEIEAVLAHEVSHVANGDMVTLALLQGVLNTFVILASRVVGTLVDKAVFRTERGYGPGFWITSLIAEILLGLLATIVVMAFSRWREFRADGGAKRLVGARPMIAALRRLRQFEDDTDLPEAMRAFGIRGGNVVTRLFASHPPLEARIARLAGTEPW